MEFLRWDSGLSVAPTSWEWCGMRRQDILKRLPPSPLVTAELRQIEKQKIRQVLPLQRKVQHCLQPPNPSNIDGFQQKSLSDQNAPVLFWRLSPTLAQAHQPPQVINPALVLSRTIATMSGLNSPADLPQAVPPHPSPYRHRLGSSAPFLPLKVH